MSPGTSEAAGSRLFCPFRMTVASLAIALANAAIAPNALDSWMKPTMALMTTTPKMTTASTHSLNTPVTTAARRRM